MKAISIYTIVLILALSSCNLQKAEKTPGYDVVVYGGTPAGITTAVQLARNQRKVLLVVQAKHVGGMYAGGLMTAEVMHMKKQCISGLADEYYMKVGQQTPEGFYHKFKPGVAPAYFFECKTAEKVFLDWLDQYAEWITVRYEAEVQAVEKEGQQITTISIGKGEQVSARYFVDCSYEGDLMRMAGVSYAVGRESRNTYNEQFAGIRFQPDTLYGTTVDAQGKRLPYFQEREGLKEGDAAQCVAAYNYRCVLTKVDSNKIAFARPADYDSTSYNVLADYLKRNPNAKLNEFFGIIKRGNGKTGFNTRQSGASSISVGLVGMQCAYPDASYAARDSIRSLYQQYTKGLFYFLSNDVRVPDSLRMEMATYGYAKDEFVDNGHFPYYFYIREAARLQGDFVFTENDILKTRSKKDAILLGSHWVDCHSIQKVALSDTSYIKEGRIWERIDQPYEIPYQVMLPKQEEANNLLVPVAVSASHVGFCSIRLESTWMQLGHAAGTAIAQIMQNQTSLHQIDLPQLQETLRKEGMVVKLEEYEMLRAKAKKKKRS